MIGSIISIVNDGLSLYRNVSALRKGSVNKIIAEHLGDMKDSLGNIDGRFAEMERAYRKKNVDWRKSLLCVYDKPISEDEGGM